MDSVVEQARATWLVLSLCRPLADDDMVALITGAMDALIEVIDFAGDLAEVAPGSPPWLEDGMIEVVGLAEGIFERLHRGVGNPQGHQR